MNDTLLDKVSVENLDALHDALCEIIKDMRSAGEDHDSCFATMRIGYASKLEILFLHLLDGVRKRQKVMDCRITKRAARTAGSLPQGSTPCARTMRRQ